MNLKVGLSLFVLSLVIPLASACTTTPDSTPTSTPAKPTVTVAGPANTSPTAAATGKPSASATTAARSDENQATRPAQTTDWKAEWDRVVAAAKKEGKVVVNGPRGALYREATMEFQKAYPDIHMEYTGSAGNGAIPKILAERQGGLYLWDVCIAGATGMLRDLNPNGGLDPLRPALILPEVLDDSKWLGGFDAGFLDKEHKNVYQFLGYLSFAIYVNRDVAPASELSQIEQLLDPRWKGKIAWQDPRRAGSGQRDAGTLLLVKGEDWFRQLLKQEIAIYDDPRRMLENFVRGQYAVSLGNTTDDFEQFKDAGLLSSIEVLDPSNPAAAQITGGSGHIGLMNRAPNPNAAKVFINWLLSQEAQKAYVHAVNNNSRRLDVEGPPKTAPKPGVQYVNTSSEEQLSVLNRASDIAREMLGKEMLR